MNTEIARKDYTKRLIETAIKAGQIDLNDFLAFIVQKQKLSLQTEEEFLLPLNYAPLLKIIKEGEYDFVDPSFFNQDFELSGNFGVVAKLISFDYDVRDFNFIQSSIEKMGFRLASKEELLYFGALKADLNDDTWICCAYDQGKPSPVLVKVLGQKKLLMRSYNYFISGTKFLVIAND